MEIIYLILLVLIFVAAVVYIRLSGGITQHIYFSYTLSVYFLFLVIPVYFYWKLEKFEELGVSIQSVFAQGVLYYVLGMFFFLLGYITKPSNPESKPLLEEGVFFSKKWLIRITLFFIMLSLAVHFSGVDTNGSFITYIWTTLDFLITLAIALYIREINKAVLVLLLTIIIIIFSIYFFRYRIYLTIMGLAAVYVYHNPNIFSKIWRYLGIGLIMAYLILFFTVNKSTFATLDFNRTEFNVLTSSDNQTGAQNILIEQGSNLHTDFTVLKYFNENTDAFHDYGSTMFIYPVIRALPASLFVDGVKPYPAPAMQLIINAYGASNSAEHAGRFVTNIFEFYLAFGLPGIVFGMFFFGIVLKYLQNRWVWDSSYNSIIQLAVLVSLFQYISRGYLPQYINHVSYLVAPVFLLRWFSKNYSAHERLMEESTNHESDGVEL